MPEEHALWPLHENDDEETVERKLRKRYPGIGLDKPRFDLDDAPLQGAPRSMWHHVIFPLVEERVARGEKVAQAIRNTRAEALASPQTGEEVKAVLPRLDEETMRKQFYAWRKRAQRRENVTTFRSRDFFDEIVFGDVKRGAEMFVRFSRATRRKIIDSWP
jgi:hypothetical protein